MTLRLSEVDGVPAVSVPTTGPTAAGLVFRVGRADETLSRAGTTHMLEHLTLFPLGLTDYHFNGSTGPITTSFHTTGSADEIVSFLGAVCEGLRNPPLHRLDVERSVIRAESANRPTSVYETLPLWRYGARTFGLLSYEELGINRITPDDLLSWSRTWFTRENAVLWVAGDIPAGLRLPLPEGRRMPVPGPTSVLPTTPAYYANGKKYVAMTGLARRRAAVGVFATVLERSLMRDLRQESGLCYAVDTSADPRGDGYSTVTVGVDAVEDKVEAVLGGFVDALAKLRVGRVAESEITAYASKAHNTAKHPDTELSLMISTATDLLVGLPLRQLDEWLAEVSAVTPRDVHAVTREVLDSALLMVPEHCRADWAGFTAAPTNSEHVVEARPLRSRTSDRLGLRVGADGVTFSIDECHTTVLFGQTATMIAWPDGARRLIGTDSFVVHLEPTLWDLPPGALAHLDRSVDPAVVVRMPPRAPEDIPRPRVDQSPPQREDTGWTRTQWVWFVLSLVASGGLFCLAGLFSVAASGDDGGPDDIGWGLPIGTWILMALCVTPAVILLVRRRKRR